MRILLLLLLLPSDLFAQDWKVDPSWLHRYVPSLGQLSLGQSNLGQPNLDRGGDLASPTCHSKPIFGEGDSENRIMLSVARFQEVTLDAPGNCRSKVYDREEAIYFVLEGTADLHYGDQIYPMRTNDFTYLPPGLKHSIANTSDKTLRVLVMGFK
ncbi:MAG: cupin domain-containing protein, partial [Candidatus Sulfotelmatobacter sp.]